MATRRLLGALLLSALVVGETTPIDRQAVVSKFNVVRTKLITNETTPLQVGNGDFAFSMDSTGLQVGHVTIVPT